jgi:hypothetical protein
MRSEEEKTEALVSSMDMSLLLQQIELLEEENEALVERLKVTTIDHDHALSTAEKVEARASSEMNELRRKHEAQLALHIEEMRRLREEGEGLKDRVRVLEEEVEFGCLQSTTTEGEAGEEEEEERQERNTRRAREREAVFSLEEDDETDSNLSFHSAQDLKLELVTC